MLKHRNRPDKERRTAKSLFSARVLACPATTMFDNLNRKIVDAVSCTRHAFFYYA